MCYEIGGIKIFFFETLTFLFVFDIINDTVKLLRSKVCCTGLENNFFGSTVLSNIYVFISRSVKDDAIEFERTTVLISNLLSIELSDQEKEGGTFYQDGENMTPFLVSGALPDSSVSLYGTLESPNQTFESVS